MKPPNLVDLQNRLPDMIVYGGVLAGVAGFADSIMNTRYGVDLGLRGTLPEPFDIPDHGMSWAMGGLLADHNYGRQLARSAVDADFVTAQDTSEDPSNRRDKISKIRRVVSAAMFSGMIVGAAYVTVGEVGSEIMHTVHDNRQESVAPAERQELPIGHFDPLDILFGVGAAVAVTRLRGKRVNSLLTAVESTIPKVKQAPKSRQTNTSHPRASKRYTPPKKRGT